MPPAAAEGDTALHQALACARERDGFLRAVARILEDASAQLARDGATCLAGGTCCKFELMGHRVYLSTGELAWLLSEAPDRPAPALPGRCPYQVGPRCTAHRRRPLGCRTYYCRSVAESRQQEVYELAHNQIRRLHEAHGVGYLYVELTSAASAALAG